MVVFANSRFRYWAVGKRNLKTYRITTEWYKITHERGGLDCHDPVSLKKQISLLLNILPESVMCLTDDVKYDIIA